MNFNEKQSNEIYEFMVKYNTDNQFRENAQQLYDSNMCKLSILHIYALEEILRYGTKNIFNLFLETKGLYTEEQAVSLYDEFVRLLREDANFRQYKMQQLKESPETLSTMEMFAFKLISSSNDEKEEMHDNMIDKFEYDPFNPILYSTDRQIRETLENLFFGEFIHQILELPEMKPIRVRQKETGRIANVDKPIIIEKIKGVMSEQNSISQFKQVIDSRYVKVKMAILLGKGEEAFEQYLNFNTNISSSEILGIEKDNSVEDIYNYIMSLVKNKKRGL